MANRFSHTRFIFWQKWLFYSSLIFALFGIAFALSGEYYWFLPYDKMIANAIWHSSQLPVDANIFRAFIYIPFGGTITCCYILLAFIAWYPFKDRKIWARNSIIFAFGIWVVIDSLGCWYFSIYPQIYIINAFSIIVKALPIAFTWNDFSRTKPKRKNISNM